MILQEQKNINIQKSGEVEKSTSMTIDTNSIHLLMGFLSKNIYSDAIGSTIREWVSNAWDATVKSGNKNPVVVRLVQENNFWKFSVEDKALGFDDTDIENVVSKYLCSTKREDNTQLGAIGIGLKSGLAYTNSFTFIGRKNGVERCWLMYEDETENKIDKLYEIPTTEENGVKFILDVDRWDVSEFSSKIREQLPYFTNVFIDDRYRPLPKDYKIYENELFKWSEIQSDNKMHVCLGDVYYPLDFAKLGISEIYIPVAIKVGLDEGIIPTINRESFMFTPQTKELLMNKIKAISTWFVERYNSENVEFETIEEAWDNIGNHEHIVEIKNKKFKINELEKWSSIPIVPLRIKEVVHNTPIFYKHNFNAFFHQFDTVAYSTYRGLKAQDFGIYSPPSDYKKVICIGTNLSGYFKQFLAEDYKPKYVFRKNDHPVDFNTFKSLIGLNEENKRNWKNLINEFKTIRDRIVKTYITDETNLHSSEAFEKFKERVRVIKARSYQGKYLNKQKGEVTLGEIVDKLVGSGYKVDKSTYKLEAMHKYKFKFLVFPEESIEDAKFLKKLVSCYNNYKVFVAGKNEIKKLTKNKNIMLFARHNAEIQDVKVLKKIVTAGLFQKTLDTYNKIFSGKTSIIEEFIKPLSKDVEIIEAYQKEYHNPKYTSIIDELISKTNEFDLTIWDSYVRVKEAITDLEFIKFLKVPSSWNSEEKTEYSKFINEQLLMRKLSKRYELSGFEISVKKEEVKEEEVTEEDLVSIS